MAAAVARVREARDDDAERLARRLRPADRREIAAASGEEPLIVLARGIAESERCWAIEDESGEPLALFGVMPGGIVWLLASERLPEYWRVFLRESRGWVEELQRGHAVLWNYVDARNTLHIRWLEWCGFSRREETTEWGVKGSRFWRYELTGR